MGKQEKGRRAAFKNSRLKTQAIFYYMFWVYSIIIIICIHCNVITTTNLDTMCHHTADSLLSFHLHSSPFPLLVTTNLFLYLWVCFYSVCSFCFFLDSTYEWDHMIFVFLCLTYFIKHNGLKILLCYCKWQDFTLLWLSSIPLKIYIFLMHSSIEGHLAYFYILATVNSAEWI